MPNITPGENYAYCAEEDLANYCTPAEGADTEGAIAAASAVVTAYTGDIFTALNGGEFYATTSRAGIATLPVTFRLIADVIDAASGTVLPATAWRADVQRQTVRLLPHGGYNLLIAGREPWADRSAAVRNVDLIITGQFGWASTPVAVSSATAMLAAAHLVATGQAAPTQAGQGLAVAEGITSISVEGYSVSYAQGAPAADAQASTGNQAVDRMLAPYRRSGKRSRWS